VQDAGGALWALECQDFVVVTLCWDACAFCLLLMSHYAYQPLQQLLHASGNTADTACFYPLAFNIVSHLERLLPLG
jgi:hypothetical protein